MVGHLPCPPFAIETFARRLFLSLLFRGLGRHQRRVDRAVLLRIAEDIGVHIDDAAGDDAETWVQHPHRDLIIEMIAIRAHLAAADRVGNGEAVGLQRRHGLMFRTDDVEIAEQYVVFRLRARRGVLGFPILPVREELHQLFDLGDAPLQLGARIPAIIDVHRAQAEAEPARLEGDQKGRARKLLPRVFGVDGGGRFLILGRLHRLGRHHQLSVRQNHFAGDLAEPDLVRSEQERYALAIAAGAFRRIGDDIVPLPPEYAYQSFERAQVAIDFLQRDEVEAAGDFREIIEALGQSGAVAELVRIEVADVPGGEQQRCRAAPRVQRRKTGAHRPKPLRAAPARHRVAAKSLPHARIVVRHDVPPIHPFVSKA